MISKKIVITNLGENLLKSKRLNSKRPETSKFLVNKIKLFKISNSDSVGANNRHSRFFIFGISRENGDCVNVGFFW